MKNAPYKPARKPHNVAARDQQPGNNSGAIEQYRLLLSM